jgi:hypothetical protein
VVSCQTCQSEGLTGAVVEALTSIAA